MYPRRTAGKKAPISASGWNAAMAAAEANDRDSRVWEVPEGTDAPLNRSIIEVVNKTGDHRKRGEVLGLDDWLHDPDSNDYLCELFEYPILKGIAPTTANHSDKFAILPFDLADGESGPAILQGLAVVQINMIAAAHAFATVSNNDPTQLKSSGSGRARILKVQSGTGTKWALVELGGGQRPIYGVADTKIHFGATGTVSIYSGTPGSEADTLANIDNCFNKGRYIYAGEPVFVDYIDGNPYVRPASGSQLIVGKTNAAHNKGVGQTVKIYKEDMATDTTDTITAFNAVANITAANKNIGIELRGSTYFITWCECPL